MTVVVAAVDAVVDNDAVAEDVAGDVVVADGMVSDAGNQVFEDDLEDVKQCPASRHPSPDVIVVAVRNTILDPGNYIRYSNWCTSNWMTTTFHTIDFDSVDQKLV